MADQTDSANGGILLEEGGLDSDWTSQLLMKNSALKSTDSSGNKDEAALPPRPPTKQTFLWEDSKPSEERADRTGTGNVRNGVQVVERADPELADTIPDLEELRADDLSRQVADAPSVQAALVLPSQLQLQPFEKPVKMADHLLNLQCLHELAAFGPQEAMVESDTIWTWDSVMRDIASEWSAASDEQPKTTSEKSLPLVGSGFTAALKPSNHTSLLSST